MIKKFKWWYKFGSPNAGRANIVQNLIYKILWRMNYIHSPSCGAYKQFKKRQQDCIDSSEELRRYIEGLEKNKD